MSRHLSRSLIAVALSTALFGVPTAFAQSAEREADERGRDTADSGSIGRKTFVVDEITVTAKGTAADYPSALATDVVSWQDAVAAPSDFQDFIVRQPGVGATGQNGVFETFSIRGSGANNILILVGGMPLAAQRRAGVPVSFIEPSLLGEINVTRGPATVHFGPGALGGAISIEPRWFDGATASGMYAESGHESELMGGIGSENFSVGVSSHRAGDSRSASGAPLDTSFERVSAILQARGEIGGFAVDALLLPSRTENIGKSNSRFPGRNTTYPYDDHTIARVRVRHENGFELSLHGHDQQLQTNNFRPNQPTTFAYIESLDLGGTAQYSVAMGSFRHNVGVEYLGRRNVNGFDARGTFESNRNFSLLDGEEDNVSVFGITDWQVSDAFAVELGARLGWNDQSQRSADTDDSDGAFSLGAIWAPDDNSRWTASLSSGYRFATLEERYFTGVTPQGEIVGSPDLSPESSLGMDIGYAWRAGAWDGQVHVWRTTVDDLIQLFPIAPGVNGFTNVGEARLHGVDAAFGWTPTADFSLRATGTVVRSKNEQTGNPLYGSPPPTLGLEAKYQFADFTFGAFWSHRFEMDRPGFEEVRRDEADVVDLELAWRFHPQWQAQVFVRNAFDENYFGTADVLSALAPERSVGLKLTWSSE